MSSKIKGKTINKACTIVCVIIGLLLLAIGAYAVYTMYKGEAPTPSDIFINAKEAISKYPYAKLVVERKEKAGDVDYSSRYEVSAERDGSYRSFTYISNDGEEMINCWRKSEDGSTFQIFLYDRAVDAWVETHYEVEPLEINLWEMFDQYADYALMDGTYNWYDTGEECYVLHSEMAYNGSYICEEAYIRKSDFMPLGVVTLGVLPSDGLDHNYVANSFNDDGSIADIEASPDTNHVVMKYSVTVSNEDQKLFDIPKKFLTEEEYMSIISDITDETEGE